MMLEPYQERLVFEHWELLKREIKLRHMIAGTPAVWFHTDTEDRMLLRMQHVAMVQYLSILQQRIIRMGRQADVAEQRDKLDRREEAAGEPNPNFNG